MTNAYDALNAYYQAYITQYTAWQANKEVKTARKAMFAYSKYLSEFETLTDAGMVPITY